MCKITTKSLEVPPSPPPSLRLRKAPRNSRCDSGRRPAFRLRYAEASADERDITKRGPQRASLEGSLSQELDDPELWRAEYPGPFGVGGAVFCRLQKLVPRSGRVYCNDYYRRSMR